MARPIVFVTDFGYRNEWVGICHAVIARTSPDSRVIDLSHGVPPLDVQAGALLLADSVSYLPGNAILLAVVEPNVGKDRDVAVETAEGRQLVGPDNGLLAPAWEALGGVRTAVGITSADVILRPVSPSFHARDVFAPAAAHLAAGMPLAELGDEIDPATLAHVTLPKPEVERRRIRCEVLDLNRFGNVQLNVRPSDLVEAGLDGVARLAVETTAASVLASRVETYADVEAGDYATLIDPRGWLAVVRGNPANAAEGLGIQTGDEVWISAAPDD
jgi:S-adenosylmethionine hydrolase